MKKRRQIKGFTLVELLATIVIISIAFGIGYSIVGNIISNKTQVEANNNTYTFNDIDITSASDASSNEINITNAFSISTEDGQYDVSDNIYTITTAGTYVLSGLSLLTINIITLGVLGIDLIKIYTYPVYIVLKKIHIINFINSIENITVLMWFFILIFTSSLSLFFSKTCLTQMFNIINKRIKIIVNIILCLLVSFLPLSLFKNKSFFDKPISALIPVIIYSITYLLIIIILVANKIKTNKKS